MRHTPNSPEVSSAMPHGLEWANASTPPSPPDKPVENIHTSGKCPCVVPDNTPKARLALGRRQSQQSHLAKVAMTTNGNIVSQQQQQSQQSKRWSNDPPMDGKQVEDLRGQLEKTLDLSESPTTMNPPNPNAVAKPMNIPQPQPPRGGAMAAALRGAPSDRPMASAALNDTPASTAPSSPWMKGNASTGQSGDSTPALMSLGAAVRHNSGTSTPRVRPTTLDIPGLTKSKVSPDGKIAQRDVGSKLVIVMVGLPARGKSYITKKLARYLNWLQHDTKIFNVGERRRNVAGGPNNAERAKTPSRDTNRISNLFLDSNGILKPDQEPGTAHATEAQPVTVAQLLLNGLEGVEVPSTPPLPAEKPRRPSEIERSLATEVLATDQLKGAPIAPEAQDTMEHNAAFFDPFNKKAAQIREQVARETLDELLDYILDGNGSVGILDATNSTLERRQMIMDHIRNRAGPALNVLFLESRCEDQDLLEANMRLKLNGPDYREMDPTIALADFKKRVQEYEKAYVPLGQYEEKNNMPFVQMIDVGRKVISHQIRGFLMAQANYYLLNFNLAPRQIWITRHGLSMDNLSGKIGGDSDLSPEGHEYAKTVTKFMDVMRREWDLKQIENLKNTHFPPQPGDVTPPNPYYHSPTPSTEKTLDDAMSSASDGTDLGYEPINFCVWTSMLRRSIQTAQYFNEDDYDTKEMRMLDELNAGVMEGLTYACIQSQFPEEYRRRKQDKLHYRYPGAGGEGYLDIINRLRPVIVELERMTDHVLLVGHRSVARVLLAYFLGLGREVVADLDVPIGMLYCLEPKPYGVDFKAYRWNRPDGWFDEVPDFKLSRAENDME